MDELRRILNILLSDYIEVSPSFTYTITYNNEVYVKLHVSEETDIGITTAQIYFILSKDYIKTGQAYDVFYAGIKEALLNEYNRRRYITCGSL